MSVRGAMLLVVAGLELVACERPAVFDPVAEARKILADCRSDSSCVRERWHRDPRNWSLGLRAEVAGSKPEAPLVVTTTREIVTPEMRETGCFPVSAREQGVYFQTGVWRKDSGEFPFAVFHWDGPNEAIAGQKEVLAAVARARGDEVKLWQEITQDSALGAAYVRFRGKRDRCQSESSPGNS